MSTIEVKQESLAPTSVTGPLDVVAWAYCAVGLAQGSILWWLQQAMQHRTWPATSGSWFGTILYPALSVPLAWYLAEGGFTTQGRRAAFVAMLGTTFALLGAHAGQSWDPAAMWQPLYGHLLAAAVIGFAIVPFVSGFDPSRRRFDYPRLFMFVWRNAVLIPVGVLLTGLFWVSLWAGAWLLDSIGLHQLGKFLGEPIVTFVATGGFFGMAIALMLARAELLLALRRFWLSLTTWFLPLVLGFAVVWVVALPFTGVSKLFGTHYAALSLLWFSALAICFANAAFQDGAEPPSFPHGLAVVLAWAWIALIPLVVLADWALWQRVAQHGWTPGRIWAAVVGLLLSARVMGYSASLLKRSLWMSALPKTNIVVAMVEVLIITLLVSPLADVRKLAVSSQVARLSSGMVSVEAFDWNFLRFQSGPYGRQALEALAQVKAGDARSKQIADRAQQTLMVKPFKPDVPAERQDPRAAMVAFQNQISVLPPGAHANVSLLEWLARENAGWDERSCVSTPLSCALWMVDIDGDGQPEGVLLLDRGRSVQATVYAMENEGWRNHGRLEGGPGDLAAWRRAIGVGHVDRVPRRWPNVALDGATLTFGP